MTERYDEETLAALARPSVAPPTSLEESSSQYPDASGKAVVDLRALRDSMAPAPGETATAGGAAAGAAQMGGAAQPATNGHDATAPAPPAGVPREAQVAAGIAAATSVVEPRPAPEPPRATAAAPEPATKGMGWAMGAAGLIVGLLVGAFVGPMVLGETAPPPEDAMAASETASTGAGSTGIAGRRGTGAAGGSADDAEEVPADDGEGAASAAAAATGADDEGSADPAGDSDDRAGTRDGATDRRAAASGGSSARRSGSRSRGSTGGAASAGAASGSDTEAQAEPAQPETGDADEPSSVNDAMLGAIAREREREQAAQEAASSKPTQPSRDNVRSVLGRMSGAIEACAAGQTGVASATLIVRGNGQVARASIGGSPFGGTPQGRCMEGVLRRARFESFDAPTFRINYPFRVD